MEKNPPKFNVGDVVQDIISGRIEEITRVEWMPDGWHYSIDWMGFYFLPEDDLVLV